MPEVEARNAVERFFNKMYKLLEGPVVHVRENIVKPNQQDYPWYHQRFARVPTIDQCYTDDPICYHEANCQYKRDRQVDSEIMSILRHRFEDCVMYQRPDHLTKCQDVLKEYKDAEANWFIKYGDLGGYHNVRTAFMKQKHRMMWENRHGPVGTGMATEFEEEEEEHHDAKDKHHEEHKHEGSKHHEEHKHHEGPKHHAKDTC